MLFMNFLGDNIPSIVLGVVFALVLFFGVKSSYKNQVQSILYALVCRAEERFGDKTGELKYAQVTEWVYDKMPALGKLFLSEKDIDLMLEKAVQQMKTALAIKPEPKKVAATKSKKEPKK